MSIKILPENIINLIAAGEVVERPASALKELIENSIDAGSTRIIIRLEEYGEKLIEVEDNGFGMENSDAELAFVQHATSKIAKEEDLNSINTLGFRGEALASIASVAEFVELETKKENSKPVKIKAESSNITLLDSNKSTTGTVISIHNLFAKVPARKKFLKNPNTEYKHLLNTFINTALINTNIHFEVFHNDKLIYRLTKTENFKERVFELFGKEISTNLIGPIHFENNFCTIDIYLGNPKISKKTATNQYTFVNNRFVIDKVIQGSITNGFSGFIHKELKPIWFAFIHINPELVDVNVHPRKLEVRFTNPKDIYGITYSLVKKSLEQESKSITIDALSNNTSEITPGFISNFNKPVQQAYKSESFGYKKSFSPKAIVSQAISFSEALLQPFDNEKSDFKSLDGFALDSVFQLFNTYILYEKDESLIIVDQHAASEKITFEKLISNLDAIKTKPLLIPKIIDLNQAQKQEILSISGELNKLGLIINDFGGESIQISEIPEFIEDHDLEGLIYELLDEPSEFKKTFSEYSRTNNSMSEKIYLMLATTACHGSIRAGQRLNSMEMKNIVNDLLKLENPYSCPHGRPVFWEFKKSEIEKNFKRVL